MATDEDILKELKKISKIITLSSGPALEKELTKYATTNERKIIWILIDGKNSVEDIAKIICKTKSAVDIFLKILERVELIEGRKYGVPPTRNLDYVPSDWIQLIPKQSEEPQSEKENKQTEVEQNE